MRYILFILLTSITATNVHGQVEPAAGHWKTWFISSGADHRLPAPASTSAEINAVISAQKALDTVGLSRITYWNAGSPGYRWQELIGSIWMKDTSYNGALANMLVGVATYDATIAAWDTKYAFNRPRPFEKDKRVKALIVKPESPSYPCEHSVAAGVAVTVIGHFYPKLRDSVEKLAQQLMNSRVAAGVSYPSDTKAGFELGKTIAIKEIEHTRGYTPAARWDGKRPSGQAYWKGDPMSPLAGLSKTVVLDSSSQFRPAPPPDFAKDMEELKAFKPNFRSMANAFRYASQSDNVLATKMFEHNLHLNPPRAARIYAITAIGMYDGYIACWDAKYTYWGTRPDQYDTTFHPVLFFTPPFPGYPSGHAAISSVMAGLYTYFFPEDKQEFEQNARDAAESRFQGGIHFRSDNEAGLILGRKVAAAIVEKAKQDGADASTPRKSSATTSPAR